MPSTIVIIRRVILRGIIKNVLIIRDDHIEVVRDKVPFRVNINIILLAVDEEDPSSNILIN